jgi:hypothetical protein
MPKPSPKQSAYLFFLKHAGYAYRPSETPQAGRSRSARQLAKAERDAVALGYQFEWRNDDEGCSGCDCGSDDCACSTGVDHETLGCLMYAPDSKDAVQSLWGICNPTREYRRVVEAELAMEALAVAQ